MQRCATYLISSRLGTQSGKLYLAILGHRLQFPELPGTRPQATIRSTVEYSATGYDSLNCLVLGHRPQEEDSWYVRVHGGPQVLRERAGTETGKVINIRCDKEKDVMSEADHWRAWEEDRSVDGDSVETIMGSDSEGQPRGRGRNASGGIIIGELVRYCVVCEM